MLQMFPQSLQNTMSRFALGSSKGFSLIELLIGSVVFLAVSIGAYTVFIKSTHRAKLAQEQGKNARNVVQFLSKFRYQVENAQPINGGPGTVLKLLRPNGYATRACSSTQEKDLNLNSGIVETSPGNKIVDRVSSGLIPYPGRDLSTMPTDFVPFDPSSETADENTHANDGIRLVYIPEDSKPSEIRVFGFWNNVKSQPTMGTYDIQGKPNGLALGDFAVLSDATRQDLVRITKVAAEDASNYRYYHALSGSAPADSIWNSQWFSAYQTPTPNQYWLSYNYGDGPGGWSNAPGNPIVGKTTFYKVRVVDYALDTTKHVLMMNDHSTDDGFNTAAGTWGAAGSNPSWKPVLSGVTKFQVVYALANGKETRTPQVGIPGVNNYDDCSVSGAAANCGCENQLGNPGLQSIRLVIEFASDNSEAARQLTLDQKTGTNFNPLMLKKPPALIGNNYPGCSTSNVLWSTLPDGTANPDCLNKFCLCANRPPPDLCTAGSPTCDVPEPGSSLTFLPYGGEGEG